MSAAVHVDVLSLRHLQMLPKLSHGNAESHRVKHVSVRVLPFIAETSSKRSAEETCTQNALLPVDWVLDRARLSAGRGANIEKASTAFEDSAYWRADFRSFCELVMPLLPEVAVIVSHGNYLREQVCTKSLCTHAVPNGGVLRVVSGGKTCYFVRHCVTCHNVDKTGGVWNTVCVNFDALEPARELVHLLKRAGTHGEVSICSSPLPRAILSGIALQRRVQEQERKRFCAVFRSCTRDLSDSSILEHAQRWSCANPERAASPFCRSGPARKGTTVSHKSQAEQDCYRKKHKRSRTREEI